MTERLAPRSRRLFLAVWPSDEMRERIVRAAAPPIARSEGRATAAGNLHVTLVFLGEVALSRVDAVLAAASGVAYPPFIIRFDQIETWPGSDVLCLTAHDSPREIHALSASLRTGLAAAGFELGRHVFRPHVTLARDVPRMRSTEAIGPIEWRVDDFVLVESNMTKTGSEYALLQRWPLRAPTREESR